MKHLVLGGNCPISLKVRGSLALADRSLPCLCETLRWLPIEQILHSKIDSLSLLQHTPYDYSRSVYSKLYRFLVSI